MTKVHEGEHLPSISRLSDRFRIALVGGVCPVCGGRLKLKRGLPLLIFTGLLSGLYPFAEFFGLLGWFSPFRLLFIVTGSASVSLIGSLLCGLSLLSILELSAARIVHR